MISFVSILLFSLLGFRAEMKTTYTVKVNGIPSVKGSLRIGVYNSEKTFPNNNEQWKGIVRKVDSKTMQVQIELPTDGDYAIAVYHDANNNGKLDKNMLGMPTEVYGFSNNARATFSAPDFSDAKFTVKSHREQSIRLQ